MREPQAIFHHHLEALEAGDVDAIAEDYADDAVFISPAGVVEGLPALREAFAGLLPAFPGLSITVTTEQYGGDALLIQWTADSELNTVSDGVDTFVFADGLIRLQTACFTPTPKA